MKGNIIDSLIYWQIFSYFIYAFKYFFGNLWQTVKFATCPQNSLWNLSAICIMYKNINYESVLLYEQSCSSLMPSALSEQYHFTDTQNIVFVPQHLLLVTTSVGRGTQTFYLIWWPSYREMVQDLGKFYIANKQGNPYWKNENLLRLLVTDTMFYLHTETTHLSNEREEEKLQEIWSPL